MVLTTSHRDWIHSLLYLSTKYLTPFIAPYRTSKYILIYTFSRASLYPANGQTNGSEFKKTSHNWNHLLRLFVPDVTNCSTLYFNVFSFFFLFAKKKKKDTVTIFILFLRKEQQLSFSSLESLRTDVASGRRILFSTPKIPPIHSIPLSYLRSFNRFHLEWKMEPFKKSPRISSARCRILSLGWPGWVPYPRPRRSAVMPTPTTASTGGQVSRFSAEREARREDGREIVVVDDVASAKGPRRRKECSPPHHVASSHASSFMRSWERGSRWVRFTPSSFAPSPSLLLPPPPFALSRLRLAAFSSSA